MLTHVSFFYTFAFHSNLKKQFKLRKCTSQAARYRWRVEKGFIIWLAEVLQADWLSSCGA